MHSPTMTARARTVALTATTLLALPLGACGSQDASDAASAAASLAPAPSPTTATAAPAATSTSTATSSGAPAVATAPDQSASQQAGDPVGPEATTAAAAADAGAAGGATSSTEDVAGAKASAQAWIDALAANDENGVIEHSMEDVWRTALADRSPSIGLKGVLQQPGVTWTVGDPVTDVQAPPPSSPARGRR